MQPAKFTLDDSNHTEYAGTPSGRPHFNSGGFIAMRTHVPSNENTAEGYAPIYHDTKSRLESVFGPRSEKVWPAGEQTCSKCYSVAPAVSVSTHP